MKIGYGVRRRAALWIWGACVSSALFGLPRVAHATEPQRFSSPEEAIQALTAAMQADDETAILKVLGSSARPLIDSGDSVADENARTHFLERYAEKHEIQKPDETTATLLIGADPWPFPLPIAHAADGWYFDTAAGQEEIINRRIGRNEYATIQACLAYTDAQREYYLRAMQGEPLRYAQKLVSSPGKRDGLYWPTDEDQLPSPLGELFAGGRSEGYALKGRGEPFHGYHFRILTAQGSDAPGGAYDYVVRGKMIGGFALVAYPAQYGVSGVMTFLVNHDGVMFEKDLGPRTADVAKAMKRFNPDATWKRVESSELAAVP